MSHDTTSVTVANQATSPTADNLASTLFPKSMVVRFTYGLASEVVLNFAAFICNEDGGITDGHDLTPEQQRFIWDIMEKFCLEHREDLGLMGPFWRTDLSVRVANDHTMNMPRLTELLTAAFAERGVTLINQQSHPRVSVRAHVQVSC